MVDYPREEISKKKRGRPRGIAEQPVDTSSASPVWDTAKLYRHSNGYCFRQFFDHYAGKYRTRFEHVLIWERVHGRCVPRNCYIHHRDLDPSNNSAENLLCIPIVLHKELHSRIEKAQKTTSELGFEVERQRITQEYERKAAELIAMWELIQDKPTE